MLFRVDGGAKELERALNGLCRRASLAIKSGYTIIILSDRGMDEEYAPIPSLLALTAVHNHLVREKTRTQVALVVESGEPREVMHFCAADRLRRKRGQPVSRDRNAGGHCPARGSCLPGVTFEKALQNYIKAVGKGLLKMFSKMGISTLQSYRGAQIFEAIGLNKEVVDKYFTGTVVPHRRGGARCARSRSADEARSCAPAGHRRRSASWISAATTSSASTASATRSTRRR